MDCILPANWSSGYKCLQQLQELSEALNESPPHYAMTCKGILGLNALLLFFPQKISFIADSVSQLEYMQLLLELIFLCENEEEWISRLFARPVREFLQKGKTLFPFNPMELQTERFQGPKDQIKKQLNEYTQWAYLDQNYDNLYLNETLSMLSADAKKCYENSLLPYVEKGICLEMKACQRLLPCWPFREPVPFSDTEFFAPNIYREYEPNTNIFYYGNLWLTNTQTFLTVKKSLLSAERCFIESNTQIKGDLTYFNDEWNISHL